MQPKIKYITNRDLLAEIKRSKTTFCHFDAAEYADYDVIVTSIDGVTDLLAEATLQTKQTRSQKAQVTLDSDLIVFRVMSDRHLPLEENEKRRKKSSTGEWVAKTNFAPFQHYILDDGLPIEVGRSHWHGGLVTGNFSLVHGRITNRLATMFMLMVDRYSRGGSWRSYSYVDEMRCHALVQLSQVGLQFDESRGDNPFAFYTQIIKNVFRRVLNLERRTQDIRDDLLIMAGAQPSHTRQIENELEQKDDWQRAIEGHSTGSEGTAAKEPPKRRGRPRIIR